MRAVVNEVRKPTTADHRVAGQVEGSFQINVSGGDGEGVGVVIGLGDATPDPLSSDGRGFDAPS